MKISMFTQSVVITYITFDIIPLRFFNLLPYIFEFFFIVWTFVSQMSFLAFPAFEIWTITVVMSMFLTYKARVFIICFLEFISSFLSFWNLCFYFNLNFSSFCNCNGLLCYSLFILTFLFFVVSFFHSYEFITHCTLTLI